MTPYEALERRAMQATREYYDGLLTWVELFERLAVIAEDAGYWESEAQATKLRDTALRILVHG